MDRVTEEFEIDVVEQVERETVIDADADGAWEAISDPAMLERWLADEVDLEPVEGARMSAGAPATMAGGWSPALARMSELFVAVLV